MQAQEKIQENAQQIQNLQEDEQDEFVLIEDLEKQGINRGDIKKAKDAGFHTCQSLLMYPKKVLCNIKGLSEAKIDKMLEAVKKILDTSSWVTATTYAKWGRMQQNLAGPVIYTHCSRMRDIVKITTGCTQLNDIIAGGVETKSITEIHGEQRTGKTQLCHTLCVTSQLPLEMGGGQGKVAYIDAEGTFRPERVIPIAQRFNLDPDAVLDNIMVARAYTFEQQFELLIGVAAKMIEEPFKLLIVDSIMGLLKVDYNGRGELSERQQKLGAFMNKLKKIADEFNIAVLVTNHVMSDPSGGAMFVADPKKPIGGHVLAHACTVRLYVRKGKGEQRVVKIVAHPQMGELEASFQICPEGITDYKE